MLRILGWKPYPLSLHFDLLRFGLLALGNGDRENTVIVAGVDFVGFDARRQADRSAERSVPAFADMVVLFLLLLLVLLLAAQGQKAFGDGDVDVKGSLKHIPCHPTP